MKYVVEKGSGVMIYVPSFIRIGLGIRKFLSGTRRQQDGVISLFVFFRNKESRLSKNGIKLVLVALV
jgi:hypothetical protein